MTDEEKAIINYIEWNITCLKSSEIDNFLAFLGKTFNIEFKSKMKIKYSLSELLLMNAGIDPFTGLRRNQ